jgi:hypothetical protein
MTEPQRHHGHDLLAEAFVRLADHGSSLQYRGVGVQGLFDLPG